MCLVLPRKPAPSYASASICTCHSLSLRASAPPLPVIISLPSFCLPSFNANFLCELTALPIFKSVWPHTNLIFHLRQTPSSSSSSSSSGTDSAAQYASIQCWSVVIEEACLSICLLHCTLFALALPPFFLPLPSLALPSHLPSHICPSISPPGPCFPLRPSPVSFMFYSSSRIVLTPPAVAFLSSLLDARQAGRHRPNFFPSP